MYSTTEEVNCICNMSKNYSEKHSLEAHGIKDWVTERNTTYFGDRFKRGYLDLILEQMDIELDWNLEISNNIKAKILSWFKRKKRKEEYSLNYLSSFCTFILHISYILPSYIVFLSSSEGSRRRIRCYNFQRRIWWIQ